MPVLYQLLFPSSLQSSFGQCCTLTVPVCCVAHFVSFLSIYLACVNCRHDASCSSCVGKAMSAFPKAPCAAPWCINNCIDEHPIPLFSVFSTSIFTAVKDETVIWWVHLERGKLGAGLSESLPASEKSLSSARCVLWARAKLTPFISSPPHNGQQVIFLLSCVFSFQPSLWLACSYPTGWTKEVWNCLYLQFCCSDADFIHTLNI